jgi:uncharacterized protein YcnI
MNKLFLSSAFALLVSAGGASAHVTLETGQATAGSTYKAVLRVPHGCDGSATTRITVRIPDGIIAVKPMPHAGWTLSTTTGPYSRFYDYYGSPLAEGVTEVSWTGGPLPDAYYDEFVFRGMVAAELAPGTVYFPVVQECETGTERWIEIPQPGEGEDDLELPAPGLEILAKP